MDERSGVLDAGVQARLERLGGSVLVEAMVAAFTEHAPERVARAERGAAIGDGATVGHAMHSLKSMAANIGAGRLYRIAESLEIDVASGGVVDLVGRTAEIARELDAVCQTIANKAGGTP